MKKVSRLAVIQMSMPNYSPKNGHCPDDEKFTEIYRTHGYIPPENLSCDGNCKPCWKKSAEKESLPTNRKANRKTLAVAPTTASSLTQGGVKMKKYLINEKQLETLKEILETMEFLPASVEEFDFGEDVYKATENEIADAKKDLKYLIEDIEQKEEIKND